MCTTSTFQDIDKLGQSGLRSFFPHIPLKLVISHAVFNINAHEQDDECDNGIKNQLE